MAPFEVFENGANRIAVGGNLVDAGREPAKWSWYSDLDWHSAGFYLLTPIVIDAYAFVRAAGKRARKALKSLAKLSKRRLSRAGERAPRSIETLEERVEFFQARF